MTERGSQTATVLGSEVRHAVLLLGGTGRTGGRVLEQLLDRGAEVRAIVRSSAGLPEGAAGRPGLTVIEADLLSLSDEELQRHAAGCGAIISCLGHTISFRGMYGSPRDLVRQAVMRSCRAIETLQPAEPVKFILMSSVSVNQPAGRDVRRGRFEKAFMAMVRAVIPPANDNQAAADFLCGGIGSRNRFVEWVAVRPDSLLEGQVTEYSVHESLVSSLFAPDSTNMANVAHFMCELVMEPTVWDAWRFGLPVINNADSK